MLVPAGSAVMSELLIRPFGAVNLGHNITGHRVCLIAKAQLPIILYYAKSVGFWV